MLCKGAIGMVQVRTDHIDADEKDVGPPYSVRHPKRRVHGMIPREFQFGRGFRRAAGIAV